MKYLMLIHLFVITVAAFIAFLLYLEKTVLFKMNKLPTIFLSHGGGPCFFMESDGEDSIFSEMDKNSDVARWYRQVAYQLKLTNPPNDATDAQLWRKPKAILVISAHWETKNSVYVTSQTDYTTLLYDYYGFPDYTYRLKYPAKGDAQLTEQVIKLVSGAAIKISADSQRNFDHGVFIPLLMVYPDADIPVVQLSINSNLDPQLHIKIGQSLAPLREQGVLIIGSGQSTHDMSFRLSKQNSKTFIDSLTNVLVNKSGQDRVDSLINWQKIPFAKSAHPREEHLIPLHVVVGAAGNDRGQLLNSHFSGSFALHSFAFE